IARFHKHIYTDDLVLDKPYRREDVGPKVALIQEWLCLHGIHVVIDGIFGPATDRAVRTFQNVKEVYEDGLVENITFAELIKPVTDALSFRFEKCDSFGNIVVECARAHLAQRPLEIGGSNKGPWVRLYLDGWQGVPWCAGFASFILKQAAFAIDDIPPFKTSFSCDLLAKNAGLKNLLLVQPDKADRSKIKPGSLFLIRKSDIHWNHTGIVTKIENGFFYSIEGNSNDTSESEGCEVCERTRGFGNKDFILI
ncbi:MAG: peptidoglycan-binding protein, partial [Candidatus Zixiibacteriota bacterium]